MRSSSVQVARLGLKITYTEIISHKLFCCIRGPIFRVPVLNFVLGAKEFNVFMFGFAWAVCGPREVATVTLLKHPGSIGTPTSNLGVRPFRPTMSFPQESEVDFLKRLVQEAQQAREEAQARFDDEKQARVKAESLNKEAQARLDDEKQARAKAESLTRQTTLLEYLESCHSYLQKGLLVETNKALTTKGSTNPRDKYYPKALKTWEDFPRLQEDCFGAYFGFLNPSDQPEARLFSPVISIQDTGRKISRRKLASEQDLEHYERLAVEDMVTDIIVALGENETVQQEWRLDEGVAFENHANSLSDTAEEVLQRLRIQTPSTSPQSSRSSSFSDISSRQCSTPKRSRADQFCVYKTRSGARELLLIVEYKPPHKLSVGNLRAGFRDMRIKEEVIDSATIPTEEGAKLQYNADRLAAAVATQAFHYMIQNGLEYSYITTGEAFVFLHIKDDEPTTLYHHVAVPTEDVDHDDPGVGFLHPRTAVAQVVGLCLMAFRSERRNHKWRRDAKTKLDKYAVDYEDVLRRIPETQRKLTPASAYRGKKNPLTVRSPYFLRRVRCMPDTLSGSRNDRYDDDPDAPREPNTGGTRQRKERHQTNVGQPEKSRNTGAGTSGKERRRQYCSQQCLLGIGRQSSLDNECPNVLHHKRHGDKHALDRSGFLYAVRMQLAHDLDNNCEPLGLQGARGALFQITLDSHGYVFVGKGTVQAFKPDLLWEGEMYGQLEKIQGTAVPVYLGNIDLDEWYNLDLGVRILHMLLMSWGGEDIERSEMVNQTPWLQDEVQRTVDDVRRAGIDQMDVRSPNILWNQEVQRAMLIDFERAVWIGSPKGRTPEQRAMQEISHNDRFKQARSPIRKRKQRRMVDPTKIDGYPVNYDGLGTVVPLQEEAKSISGFTNSQITSDDWALPDN